MLCKGSGEEVTAKRTVDGMRIVKLEGNLNMNNTVVRAQDKVSIEFSPDELDNIMLALKKMAERSGNFDEQINLHAWVQRFTKAKKFWEDARTKKWEEDHPKGSA
jgi:hypothetical protein